ncbi:unnamed protein product [Gordionus sp. m RMFG-2023]
MKNTLTIDNVIIKLSRIQNFLCSLHCTSCTINLNPQLNKIPSFIIPYSVIDNYERIFNLSTNILKIYCKNLKIIFLEFTNLDNLLQLCTVIDNHDSHILTNLNDGLPIPDFFNLEKEYSLLILNLQTWKVVDINKGYNICSSYPEKLPIPFSVSEHTLFKCASFRNKNRFPILSFIYPGSQGCLLRSAQPLIGLNNTHCKFDEEYLNYILPKGKRGYIVDTRSNLAINNAKNLGGGTEHESRYPQWKKIYIPIDITCFQQSYKKLTTACLDVNITSDKWLSVLESCNWLSHLHTLLNGAKILSDLLKNTGSPILIHGTNGTDATLQLTSLIQILLNPECRTFKGFQSLIQREWIWAGHPFRDRCSSGPFALSDTSNNYMPNTTNNIDPLLESLNNFTNSSTNFSSFLNPKIDSKNENSPTDFQTTTSAFKNLGLWFDSYLRFPFPEEATPLVPDKIQIGVITNTMDNGEFSEEIKDNYTYKKDDKSSGVNVLDGGDTCIVTGRASNELNSEVSDANENTFVDNISIVDEDVVNNPQIAVGSDSSSSDFIFTVEDGLNDKTEIESEINPIMQQGYTIPLQAPTFTRQKCSLKSFSSSSSHFSAATQGPKTYSKKYIGHHNNEKAFHSFHKNGNSNIYNYRNDESHSSSFEVVNSVLPQPSTLPSAASPKKMSTVDGNFAKPGNYASNGVGGGGFLNRAKTNFLQSILTGTGHMKSMKGNTRNWNSEKSEYSTLNKTPLLTENSLSSSLSQPKDYEKDQIVAKDDELVITAQNVGVASMLPHCDNDYDKSFIGLKFDGQKSCAISSNDVIKRDTGINNGTGKLGKSLIGASFQSYKQNFNTLLNSNIINPSNANSTNKTNDALGVNGIERNAGNSSDNICPTFLIFLDCVLQLMRQFPTSFEFNSDFILSLFQHAYSSPFDTFSWNDCRKRITRMPTSKNISYWHYVNMNDVKIGFMNIFYESHLQKTRWDSLNFADGSLDLSTNPQNIQLSSELFSLWTMYDYPNETYLDLDMPTPPFTKYALTENLYRNMSQEISMLEAKIKLIKKCL